MSFLIDPPLLVASGATASRLLRHDRSRSLVRRVVLGVFLGVSISLYANAGWVRRMWESLGAESGRDWMINSGVTHFEHERPTPAVHALSAAIFATYPLWYRLGARLVRRASV